MRYGTIHHKPCDGLPDVADESVDVIDGSPPYNIRQLRPQRGKEHNVVYSQYVDALPAEQYVAQQIDIINHCMRVLKPHGSMFYVHKARAVKGSLVDPLSWILSADCRLYQKVVWDRGSTHITPASKC